MTLILSCLTHEHVVQVSDRRLTWVAGPNKGKIADDDRNKATLFCFGMAFAYTGLAEIPNEETNIWEKTDVWLTNVLANISPPSPSNGVRAIGERATRSFNRINATPEIKRHAFVGVGWVHPPAGSSLKAITCSVSNALDQKGQWLPKAHNTFTIQHSFLSDTDTFVFTSAGQPLRPWQTRKIKQKLQKRIANDAGPQALIAILAEGIRRTAHNNAVGKNLMAVSLPKTAVEAAIQSGGYIFKSGSPDRDTLTFMYMADNKRDGVMFGPNFACDGWGTTDFRQISK